MLEMLSPGHSLTWDLIWQSSVFLGLGLAASLAIRGRPARAHRLLVLTMIAALGTPLLAQAFRHGGWGLLSQPASSAAGVEQAITGERETAPAELIRVSQPLPGPGNTRPQIRPDRLFDSERSPQEAGIALHARDEDHSGESS